MWTERVESRESRVASRYGLRGRIDIAPSAIRATLSTLNSRLLALFGMPDYRRYLAHQMAHHPTEPVMCEKEFVRSELERKYAGGGSRCC